MSYANGTKPAVELLHHFRGQTQLVLIFTWNVNVDVARTHVQFSGHGYAVVSVAAAFSIPVFRKGNQRCLLTTL